MIFNYVLLYHVYIMFIIYINILYIIYIIHYVYIYIYSKYLCIYIYTYIINIYIHKYVYYFDIEHHSEKNVTNYFTDRRMVGSLSPCGFPAVSLVLKKLHGLCAAFVINASARNLLRPGPASTKNWSFFPSQCNHQSNKDGGPNSHYSNPKKRWKRN